MKDKYIKNQEISIFYTSNTRLRLSTLSQIFEYKFYFLWVLQNIPVIKIKLKVIEI